MFTKKEIDLLGEIFTLARLQTVNSNPKNRQQLENVMNFEAHISSKIIAANEKLGFVEEEQIETESQSNSPEEVKEPIKSV